MKKIIFAIIVLLVAGYIFKTQFGSFIPSTEELQGNVMDIKNDIQKSAQNLTDEINRVTEGFKTKKEAVEEKVEKVENLIDAVNDLTE